jgi:hypothetical protein
MIIERPVKQVEIIEKLGNLKKPKTFNNQFNDLQVRIIKLLKYNSNLCLTNGKIDYGKIYLRLLMEDNIIDINYLPEKLLSPESPDRIIRKLMEYAEYNNELEFLLKFKKNNDLDNESKEYYRSN